MSKQINNPINSCRRIGDLTFYQRAGQLVTRIRHNGPNHHPPSQSQLLQRSQMGNLVNLWRAFPVGQHPEYQHRPNGVTNYNLFIASGLHAHQVYLPNTLTRRGACVVTDVLVSQGLLPSIGVRLDGTVPATDLWLDNRDIDGTSPVNQLARAIIQNNADYLHGDSLLFYLFEQYWSQHLDQPMVKVSRTELVLDLTDERPLQEAVGHSIGFAQRDGWLAASHMVEGGLAWVHLRHGEEGLLSSTQRLVCNNPIWERYEEFSV